MQRAGARRSKRGPEACSDAAYECEAKAKQNHSWSNGDVFDFRNVSEMRASDGVKAPHGEGNPNAAAHEREQDGLAHNVARD